MRAVSVPFSPARPSRLKNEPGILPAAYMRSSTSTVRGRKSASRRFPITAVQNTMVSPARTTTAPVACLASLPGLQRDLLTGDLDTNALHGVRHIQFPFGSALRSAECFVLYLFIRTERNPSGWPGMRRFCRRPHKRPAKAVACRTAVRTTRLFCGCCTRRPLPRDSDCGNAQFGEQVSVLLAVIFEGPPGSIGVCQPSNSTTRRPGVNRTSTRVPFTCTFISCGGSL